MKLTILILLLFAKNCQSQEINEKPNNKVTVEYTKPLRGFKVKIYWTLKDSIPNVDNKIYGDAILELERRTDKTKFKINYKNYSIADNVCSVKIFEAFKKKKVPNIIQINYSPDFYFKDVTFDKIDEIIINEIIIGELNISDEPETVERVFEFKNDNLVELKSFPILALDETKGYFDYKKKEIITTDFYTCCEYVEAFYKYDKNSKEPFIYYKTLHHKVDPKTNDEEISIEEPGKQKVTIFRKNNKSKYGK